jgi:hypothetical protein
MAKCLNWIPLDTIAGRVKMRAKMLKLPRDPDRVVCKYGFAVILAIELYKFIKFIAR